MANRVLAEDGPEGSYDTLDGRRLQPGDKLYIKWAGSVMQVEVQINDLASTASLNGEVVEVVHCRAFFTLSVQGSGSKIYLRGFEAQRAV